MLFIELPQLNVLSKIDLLQETQFNLDFYTEASDLSYLIDHLNKDYCTAKFLKLNGAICQLIEDYSLVSFSTLDIQVQSP
jgi:hypothetical protein